MNIPQEAIEKAARVGINNYSDAHPNCDPKLARWEDYDEDDRAEVLRQVREELEAAFPVLAAHVLDEAADAVNAKIERVKRNVGPKIAQDSWKSFGAQALIALDLRARAAEYREGKPATATPPVSCRCEFGWQPECPHHGDDAYRERATA